MRSTNLATMTAASTGTRKRRTYAARVPQDERRQQLLDAALRLIARDGYAGLTVEAVAAEAGVTKPVLYGVYARLPLLLGELLDRTQADALAQLLAALPQDAGAERSPTLTADVTRAWATAVRGNPTTWAPILLSGAQAPEVVLARIEAGREKLRRSLEHVLAAPGKVDAPTRKRLAMGAEAIVAAAEHFGRLMLVRPDAVDDDILVALFDDLVRAISARRSTPA